MRQPQDRLGGQAGAQATAPGVSEVPWGQGQLQLRRPGWHGQLCLSWSLAPLGHGLERH